MKMGQWNEKQIEELLTRMPKPNDDRSLQEVYQSIQKKMERKPQRMWILSGLASAAVALLLVVLALPLFPPEEKLEPSSAQNQAGMEKGGQPAVEVQKQNGQGIMVKPSLLKPEGKNYITVAAPDQSIQFVVPLTYMVKDEGDAIVQSIKKKAGELDEEKLGLSKNIIQDLNLMESQHLVKVTVEANHPYGIGSTAETMFIDSLEETFRWLPYDEVEFETDGRKGIRLGNTGELKTLPIHPILRKAYLIYQLDKDHPKLLAPTHESYKTFGEAMEAMKKDDELDKLHASIPDDVKIEKIKSDETHLIIRFSNDTKLRNEEQYVYMLHAIMLTARDFGYKSIKFEGGTIDKVGDIRLQERYTVPAAPNVITPKNEER
ncbi:hypothetical protein ACFOU2_04305 [Bacillus songklensis]|uniref:Negative regulator of sigma-X activity n=1 Tax=Bacillus songklensis TaxID=1069116 RepID=A0ABV8B0K5_9BACI